MNRELTDAEIERIAKQGDKQTRNASVYINKLLGERAYYRRLLDLDKPTHKPTEFK